MIDTWTTMQPKTAARPGPLEGTGSPAAFGGIVAARFRGTGLPSDVRNGITVAAAAKGADSSSRAWRPPV